jgi:hypothetical protein
MPAQLEGPVLPAQAEDSDRTPNLGPEAWASESAAQPTRLTPRLSYKE